MSTQKLILFKYSDFFFLNSYYKRPSIVLQKATWCLRRNGYWGDSRVSKALDTDFGLVEFLKLFHTIIGGISMISSCHFSSVKCVCVCRGVGLCWLLLCAMYGFPFFEIMYGLLGGVYMDNNLFCFFLVGMQSNCNIKS